MLSEVYQLLEDNYLPLFYQSHEVHVVLPPSLPPSLPPIGDALLTVATGPLSDREAERAGLVPTHAYAVLNVIEIKVRGNCNVCSNTNLKVKGHICPTIQLIMHLSHMVV